MKRAELLKDLRNVPDYPMAGVQFKELFSVGFAYTIGARK